MKNKKTELIVALDTASLDEAQKIISELSGTVKFFKIGSQLFTASGPKAVEAVKKAGARVFLDLKFHDIPNTVAQAALSALGLGVDMFNVHALGGKLMLSEVSKAMAKAGTKKPIVLGVTILTSMDRQQLNSIGVNRSVKNEVISLAKLCRACGLDGVVCSGNELKILRRTIGDDFVLVTPGVRPLEAGLDDQKRVVTPAQARDWGADYIVVGRPVLAAKNREQAAASIIAELASA